MFLGAEERKLRGYITTLLSMKRQEIDELSVSSSSGTMSKDDSTLISGSSVGFPEKDPAMTTEDFAAATPESNSNNKTVKNVRFSDSVSTSECSLIKNPVRKTKK